MPRYGEVKAVLDAAAECGKTLFSHKQAPFTSNLEPQQAAEALLGLGPFAPLDTATGTTYFARVSTSTEAQLQRMIGVFG